ncbi:hypothetical protein CDCA_CDCA09G2840 [Cyanidium caldarium]|uniref:Exoribonuclease phosphorolytic domain-containing protein n=1 Tax=Cyanidium caldarium TaxID=2771 RepID=A0AAV9IXI4_CYACA|nr:hypothetical protein CDCA_CDCA09G2840 [Cyanidium caldarium]
MGVPELLSGDGLRLDGRREGEVRRLTVELGTVSGADGSAYVEQGQTRVLVAVYGPLEPPGGGGSVYQSLLAASTAAALESCASAGRTPRRPGRRVHTMEIEENDEILDEGECAGVPEKPLRVLPPATAMGRVRCEYSVASFASAPASARAFRAQRRRQQQRHRAAAAAGDVSAPPDSTAGSASRPSKFERQSREAAARIRQVFEGVILSGGDARSGGTSRLMPPHAVVDVFVQVLQSDGGELAVAINAASLALVHAGVPMRGLPVACSATALPHQRKLVPAVDPSAWEMRQASLANTAMGGVPQVTVVTLPSEADDRMPLLYVDYQAATSLPEQPGIPPTRATGDLFEQVAHLAASVGCPQLHRVMHTAAVAHLGQELARREWSATAAFIAAVQ